MKVVFYQKVNSIWRELLEPVRKELPDLELITDYEQADRHVPDAEVIVGGKIAREVFERAEKLQLVIVPFTGVNHLPFDLLQEKGVRVANSHGNAFYVAEKTVGLILAYYGRVIEFHNDMRRTKWHGFWVGKGLDDSWESIAGKSAAILGTGEIGKYTAGLLKAFRVHTIGYKRTKVRTIPEGFDEMIYSIDEAIETADIIVVALPATDATRGLIGEQQLRRMQNKLLVNIGRGSIVDEAALYEALRAGTLGGA
ncbi:MAG: NAD(P)-dependent oxidoreductase, partial [Spirochaetota bacterium]